MANTAALLLNLLNTKADINYYTQQSVYWNAKYEANYAKLSKQVKAEEKWMDAYDSCYYAEEGKEVRIGNGNPFTSGDECEAIAYADQKVREYDEELSLELADLDMTYDTMKTMFDSLLEQMRAQQESQKTATSNAAQDTGLLQS
jgi:hypothetical protein